MAIFPPPRPNSSFAPAQMTNEQKIAATRAKIAANPQAQAQSAYMNAMAQAAKSGYNGLTGNAAALAYQKANPFSNKLTPAAPVNPYTMPQPQPAYPKEPIGLDYVSNPIDPNAAAANQYQKWLADAKEREAQMPGSTMLAPMPAPPSGMPSNQLSDAQQAAIQRQIDLQKTTSGYLSTLSGPNSSMQDRVSAYNSLIQADPRMKGSVMDPSDPANAQRYASMGVPSLAPTGMPISQPIGMPVNQQPTGGIANAAPWLAAGMNNGFSSPANNMPAPYMPSYTPQQEQIGTPPPNLQPYQGPQTSSIQPYTGPATYSQPLQGYLATPSQTQQVQAQNNLSTQSQPQSSTPSPKAYGGAVRRFAGGGRASFDKYELQKTGINEAINMSPKGFFSPDKMGGFKVPSAGGVSMPNGMPIGGVDMSKQQPGQQLAPQPPAPPQMQGAPQPPPQQGGAPPPMGNMLNMTPQGQAMSAMRPPAAPPPPPPQAGTPPEGMAEGGSARTFQIKPASQMKKEETDEHNIYDSSNPTTMKLAKAFDEAISHHLSLSPQERAENSMRMNKRVGAHIGTVQNGLSKDLLGENEKLKKAKRGYEGFDPINLPDGRGVETTGLALAPAYQEGKFNTCPNSASCKHECLGKTSGNYFKLGGGQDLSAFKGPRLNSLRKTVAFLRDPHAFAVKLYDEINQAKQMAAENGNHLGVRLNVLSDIHPRVHKAIIDNHDDVTFYDYTKNNTDPIAPNHHYTHSSTGVSQPGINENTNWSKMRKRLVNGDNVAMAFTHHEHLPHWVHDQETGQKFKVIDGDDHDFRPLDMQPEGEHGVIIGLRNKKATGEKHKAHIDSNGFFVHYDPQLKMAKSADGKRNVYERLPSNKISKKTGKPMLGETIPQNRVVNILPQEKGTIIRNNDGEAV